MNLIKLTDKQTETIGWIASLMAMVMFLSYFDQIRLNLLGQKGSVFIPITAMINCTTWLLFGIGKENRQIIFCNVIGIIVSFFWLITALI